MVLSKEAIKSGVKVVGRFCKRNLPSILIGLGVGGMIVGTIEAAKETPKVQEDIKKQEEIEKQIAETMGWEPKKDIWARSKIYAKHYWKTAAIDAVSIGSILIGNGKHLKLESTLASALTLANKNYEDLANKIREVDGQKKLDKLQSDISQDILNQNPADENLIGIIDKGEHLFYDALLGRYFRSNIDRVKRAETELNRTLMNSGYCDLNYFYAQIDPHLFKNDIGDFLGWTLNNNNDTVEVRFDTMIEPTTQEPCIVMKFDQLPTYGYDQYN